MVVLVLTLSCLLWPGLHPTRVSERSGRNRVSHSLRPEVWVIDKLGRSDEGLQNRPMSWSLACLGWSFPSRSAVCSDLLEKRCHFLECASCRWLVQLFCKLGCCGCLTLCFPSPRQWGWCYYTPPSSPAAAEESDVSIAKTKESSQLNEKLGMAETLPLVSQPLSVCKIIPLPPPTCVKSHRSPPSPPASMRGDGGVRALARLCCSVLPVPVLIITRQDHNR